MPKVVIAGKIHPEGVALLANEPGMEVRYIEEVSAESFAPFLPDADALLIRTQPLSARFIAAAPRLRIVSRHGVGYDAVDLAALNARKITLTVVGDVNSRAVAEHAVMLMLSAARRNLVFDGKMRAGDWKYRDSADCDELDGKTVLIVGFGRIGRRVAEIAAVLGMRVLVHDRFVEASAIARTGAIPVAGLAEGLGQADAVTLHVPKTGAGFLIGAAELALMKPSAILVNTARGGLVDEAALISALDGKRLAAAGLDVFESEPPRRDDPLLSCGRVVLTPHNAALTAACTRRMALAAARNVIDFFGGRLDPSFVVNRFDA